MNAALRAFAADPAWALGEDEVAPHHVGLGSRVAVSLDGRMEERFYRSGVVIWWACGQGVLDLDEPGEDGARALTFWFFEIAAIEAVPLSIRERACLCLAHCEVLP